MMSDTLIFNSVVDITMYEVENARKVGGKTN